MQKISPCADDVARGHPRNGAEMLQPLAIAVIGGLAFALVLSLVVTPTVFAWLYRPHRREGGA